MLNNMLQIYCLKVLDAAVGYLLLKVIFLLCSYICL